MRPADYDRWKGHALDAVFEGLATSPSLTDWLVFKGARVLNLRLRTEERQSMDIDSNLDPAFARALPDRAEQREAIEREVETTLRAYFEDQDPVRYTVTRVIVRAPKPHPRRWDSFAVTINITDRANPNARFLPALTIDVAAPEVLGEASIAPLAVGDAEVRAYTLERIAGEKLRAFLSSLPAYRRKTKKPGKSEESVRVKDVYDLARIHARFPVSNEAFWRSAGAEFARACQSRYIDCIGLETFEDELATTRTLYTSDPTLPDNIQFDEAWGIIRGVIQAFEKWDLIPFMFPLPPRDP